MASLASAGLVFAGQVPAATSARWQPWLGCWQLVDENVTDGALDPVEAAAEGATTDTRGRRAARVCVTPAAEHAVKLTTMVGNQIALEETVVADGRERPVSDVECRGTQRAEWAAAGPQLFARTQLTCGAEPPRTVWGLSLLIAGPTWIDLQLIEGGRQKSLRVRRYRRSLDQTVAGQPIPPPAPLPEPLPPAFGFEDVKHASKVLPSPLLEAALVETGARFNLNRTRLIDLDESGVPGSVIDVMVALSYPRLFIIDRPAASVWSSGGVAGEWPLMGDPLFWPPYYAPFRYSYWARYDPWYYPGSGYVVIDDPSPSSRPRASGEGRVVDGRGYTRVRSRPVDGDGGGSSGGSSSGSSGNSGGSASPAGYSSGGGGGDSGRTAVSRPPG